MKRNSIDIGYSMAQFHGGMDTLDAEFAHHQGEDRRLKAEREKTAAAAQLPPEMVKAKQINAYVLRCWDRDIAPSEDWIATRLRPVYHALTDIEAVASHNAAGSQVFGMIAETARVARNA